MAELYHTGTPHEGSTPHSGRYPWGSGDNPHQRQYAFYEHVEAMRAKGLSDSEIAKGLGLSEKDFKAQYFYNKVRTLRKQGKTDKEIATQEGMTVRELKSRYSVAGIENRQAKVSEAKRLTEQGFTPTQIGKMYGVNESTVRSWLNDDISDRQQITLSTADVLAKEVGKAKYVDVGLGVAESMGITRTRLDAAVQYLKDNGYEVHKLRVPQITNFEKKTEMLVLCEPGTTWRDVKDHQDDIGIVNARFKDPEGRSVFGLKPVESISSKRIEVAYLEDGGIHKDGVIELRRGVEGLSLGQANYAQVRIGVDDKYYLKGMAIYSDDLPAGVDIRFNTNKSKNDPNIKSKTDVFKAMKTDANGNIDQANPFGTAIKEGGQRGYLNIVREEGDWASWKNTLASQFLSKQPVILAEKQLNLTQEIRKQEFDEIKSLTNPVVKKHLLEQFADGCDRDAVHLKAASMPRQSSRVILPLDDIKPNQIYAPGYKDGEKVVLIRYPHGGTFEIPELTVNNRNREGKKLFPAAQDAVGIHHSVAERLSGADFDGDTVVVIPNNNKKILSRHPLKDLEGFDPKTAYPYRQGIKVMPDSGPDGTQMQMGKISNLITDMTLKDAPDDHIARAVKHSMVVIDAHKHKLDYQQSEIDNNILELQRLYQSKGEGTRAGGASTLISKAKSPIYVDHRRALKGDRGIDPKTGEKVYYYTGEVRKDTGTPKKTKSTKMAEAKDARELISVPGTYMEGLYAQHANAMKGLANQARKEYLKTKDPVQSKGARLQYKGEVESLQGKVADAVQHQPYERKAQVLANHVVSMRVRDNPSMTKEERKKAGTQALIEMRSRLGGKKPTVTITDKEWEAIQAGAVSKTALKQILNYADQDAVKQRALPKESKGMTASKIQLAKMMKANGYSLEDIAARCGVSKSTVSKALAD